MTVVAEPETLTPIQWAALAVLARKAADFRNEVQPCSREQVDILLRIRGSVSIGADSETTQWSKPSAEDVLAFVIRYLGSQAGEALIAAMLEDAKVNGGILGRLDDPVAKSAAKIMKDCSTTKRASRKGSTRGSFEVGLVDQKQLSVPMANTIKSFTRVFSFGDAEDVTA